MKANYSVPIGKMSAVKIKYAPQLELMAVEPARITSPTVEVARPFDWTPLVLLVILVGLGIACGQFLRNGGRRRSPRNEAAGAFSIEATPHST